MPNVSIQQNNPEKTNGTAGDDGSVFAALQKSCRDHVREAKNLDNKRAGDIKYTVCCLPGGRETASMKSD